MVTPVKIWQSIRTRFTLRFPCEVKKGLTDPAEYKSSSRQAQVVVGVGSSERVSHHFFDKLSIFVLPKYAFYP